MPDYPDMPEKTIQTARKKQTEAADVLRILICIIREPIVL